MRFTAQNTQQQQQQQHIGPAYSQPMFTQQQTHTPSIAPGVAAPVAPQMAVELKQEPTHAMAQQQQQQQHHQSLSQMHAPDPRRSGLPMCAPILAPFVPAAAAYHLQQIHAHPQQLQPTQLQPVGAQMMPPLQPLPHQLFAQLGAMLSPEAKAARIATLLAEADSLRHRNHPLEALQKYTEVLAMDPLNVTALNLKGTCYRLLKKPLEALECYRSAMILAPTEWSVANNAAIVYKEMAMLDEAVALYEQAIANGPPDCVAKLNLAVVRTDLGTKFKLAGNLEAATACYEEALKLNPTYHPAFFNLGVVKSEVGDIDAALAAYERAVEANPSYVEALCNIGVIWKNRNQLDKAIEYYQRALSKAPNFAIAASNLSIALTDVGTNKKTEGKIDEGIELYKQALAHNSKYPAAWYNLGVAYAERGRSDDAKVCYEMAVLFDPKCAEAYNNLGVIFKDRGNLDAAVQSYHMALQANPSFSQTLNNLGVIFTMLGKLDEAHEYCSRAIKANRNYAEAHNNLGVLYRDEGKIDEAIAAYTDCLSIDPSSRNAAQNRLLALNSVCGGSSSADEATSESSFLAHAQWGAMFARMYAASCFTSWSNPRTLGRPLRVGYISADFFTHSVSYFIEAPLAFADPAQTHVTCYSNVARTDSKTAHLQTLSHAWRSVHDKSASAVAQMVRDDGIDILVELTGHTGGNRLDVMALKPAPVQCTWIGYPNTTGLPTIDYRITDATVDPVDSSQKFSETLVRLPGCFLCYTPPSDAPAVSPTPALRSGFVTFGSMNNLAKVNDRVLACWCDILAAVPNSRMLIKCKPFASASVRAKTLQRFAERGIDAARIDLVPLLPTTAEHLATYAGVDVCVDTFPYAGTTTTCEALYCGVPVVTYASRKPNLHAHNVGATLLSRIQGASSLIAESEQQYVAVAVSLAQNIPALQSMRESLRPAMLQSALCNGPAFVAGLTATYQQMWAHYCNSATQ